MKRLHSILFLVFVSLYSCNSTSKIELEKSSLESSEALKAEVEATLNLWHKAAGEANYEDYFNLMTNEGVFIGTDATENWQNEAFKTFSKPYFDKGKAWDFTPVERNVYVYDDKKLVWFDELLDTQMKLCRGSGVMKLVKGKWKVAHYVLSITIPNDNVNEVIKIKANTDSILTQKLKIKD